MEYTQRSITSLTELKPGDHIVVEDSAAQPDDKTSGKESSHHLLVVEVANYKYAKVIHSVSAQPRGVIEEEKRILPRYVTVLDYKAQYTGETAVARARHMQALNSSQAKDKMLVWSNSEGFVRQVRTGADTCKHFTGIDVKQLIDEVKEADVKKGQSMEP